MRALSAFVQASRTLRRALQDPWSRRAHLLAAGAGHRSGADRSEHLRRHPRVELRQGRRGGVCTPRFPANLGAAREKERQEGKPCLCLSAPGLEFASPWTAASPLRRRQRAEGVGRGQAAAGARAGARGAAGPACPRPGGWAAAAAAEPEPEPWRWRGRAGGRCAGRWARWGCCGRSARRGRSSCWASGGT